jgi:hypothetical protein
VSGQIVEKTYPSQPDDGSVLCRQAGEGAKPARPSHFPSSPRGALPSRSVGLQIVHVVDLRILIGEISLEDYTGTSIFHCDWF